MRALRLKRFVALLVVLLLLSGCQARSTNSSATTSSSASQDENPASSGSTFTPLKQPDEPDSEAIGLLEEIDVTQSESFSYALPLDGDNSPVVDWNGQKTSTVRIYKYDYDAAQYSAYLLPAPEQEITLRQLAQTALDPFGYYASIMQIDAVRQEKDMAIVNLQIDPERIEPYFSGLSETRSYLDSVARSLIEAHSSITHVGFTMNGGQFKTPALTLEADGYGSFEAAPLYSNVTDEQYRSLREQMTYPPLKEPMRWGDLPCYDSSVPQEMQLAELAKLLTLAGVPEDGAFSNLFFLQQALSALPLATAQSSAAAYSNEFSFPQAAPIAQAVSDTEFVPREWVEQAVQELYGPDTSVQHQHVWKWRWHAREGVYTPPHIGGVMVVQPYLFSVQEQPEGYLVELVYLRLGMGNYQDENGDWLDYAQYTEMGEPLLKDDPQVQDLLKNRLPHYLAQVCKTADGKLYLKSLKLK